MNLLEAYLECTKDDSLEFWDGTLWFRGGGLWYTPEEWLKKNKNVVISKAVDTTAKTRKRITNLEKCVEDFSEWYENSTEKGKFREILSKYIKD